MGVTFGHLMMSFIFVLIATVAVAQHDQEDHDKVKRRSDINVFFQNDDWCHKNNIDLIDGRCLESEIQLVREGVEVPWEEVYNNVTQEYFFFVAGGMNRIVISTMTM